jgi:hypothetical protein
MVPCILSVDTPCIIGHGESYVLAGTGPEVLQDVGEDVAIPVNEHLTTRQPLYDTRGRLPVAHLAKQTNTTEQRNDSWWERLARQLNGVTLGHWVSASLSCATGSSCLQRLYLLAKPQCSPLSLPSPLSSSRKASPRPPVYVETASRTPPLAIACTASPSVQHSAHPALFARILPEPEPWPRPWTTILKPRIAPAKTGCPAPPAVC